MFMCVRSCTCRACTCAYVRTRVRAYQHLQSRCRSTSGLAWTHHCLLLQWQWHWYCYWHSTPHCSPPEAKQTQTQAQTQTQTLWVGWNRMEVG